MFKDFVVSVITLAFLSSICELIAPEGSLKKYLKLAIGFIMMSVLIGPIIKNTDLSAFKFSFDDEMTNEEITAESNAYILKLHEETIVNYIKEVCGSEKEVFVEIYSDGRVKSVRINGEVPLNTIEQLNKELGCDDISMSGW